jgi:hypothetical protein
VGYYVGHSFVIGIAATDDRELSSLPSRLCIKNTMDSPMFLHLLCKNTNVVFRVQMFEDETCFKQVNVVFHTFFILIYKTL